eukprot:c8955_g1_i1.p1 GENE.c8955_g1_i1~~c8955_g1_i1.p1  ORF type:complete len:772 (-),score=230.50 c8955_g1_i1:60-2264(-)
MQMVTPVPVPLQTAHPTTHPIPTATTAPTTSAPVTNPDGSVAAVPTPNPNPNPMLSLPNAPTVGVPPKPLPTTTPAQQQPSPLQILFNRGITHFYAASLLTGTTTTGSASSATAAFKPEEDIWNRLKEKHPKIVHATEMSLHGMELIFSNVTVIETTLDIIIKAVHPLLEQHGNLSETTIAEAHQIVSRITSLSRTALPASLSAEQQQQFDLWSKCVSNITAVVAGLSTTTNVRTLLEPLLHWQSILTNNLKLQPRWLSLRSVTESFFDRLDEMNVAFMVPHQLVAAFAHTSTASVPYPNSHTDNHTTFPGTWAQIKWFRVRPHLSVGRRFGTSGRGLHILCSDGRTRSLWIRQRPLSAVLSHQKTAKIARIVHNQMQHHHITSQSIGLSLRFPSPLCVSNDIEACWYEGRLQANSVTPPTFDSDCCWKNSGGFEAAIAQTNTEFSMEDVMEANFSECAASPCEAIAVFWCQLHKAVMQQQSENNEDAPMEDEESGVESNKFLQRKIQLISDISASLVPNFILTRYIQRQLPTSFDHVWSLRRRFALRYGALTLFSHMLGIKHHRPDEIQMSIGSGCVYLSNPIIQFREDGLGIASQHQLPFYIPHNVVNFLRPFGLGGPFVTAISVMAEAVVTPSDHIESVMRLVFRSEILSRIPSLMNDSPTPLLTASHAAKESSRNALANMKQFVVEDALDSEEPMKGAIKPINAHVLKLIEASMNPQERASVSVALQPWF